ncbi:MAG: AAA family ATPase [Candidatus Saccharibacteria bacterium]|nr:AAA family ATPase [Candidatus Saccharibacteria bacterium]
MGIDSNLIVKNVALLRGEVESFKKYPFNIDVVKNFKELKFNSQVTFFIGENGTGKSTLIEAIAVALGMPAEGGTNNFMYETKNTTSELSEYLRIGVYRRPKTKFFLRAESFYNFSTEVERLVKEDHFWALRSSYGGSLHECSHGESFLRLVQNRFTDHGLYILDEPEAALSPQRQLSLLCLMDQLVKEGSQFIIATHSPILISYREGEILDLNNGMKRVAYKDTDIYSLYKMYLDEPGNMQHRLFD